MINSYKSNYTGEQIDEAVGKALDMPTLSVTGEQIDEAVGRIISGNNGVYREVNITSALYPQFSMHLVFCSKDTSDITTYQELVNIMAKERVVLTGVCPGITFNRYEYYRFDLSSQSIIINSGSSIDVSDVATYEPVVSEFKYILP